MVKDSINGTDYPQNNSSTRSNDMTAKLTIEQIIYIVGGITALTVLFAICFACYRYRTIQRNRSKNKRCRKDSGKEQTSMAQDVDTSNNFAKGSWERNGSALFGENKNGLKLLPLGVTQNSVDYFERTYGHLASADGPYIGNLDINYTEYTVLMTQTDMTAKTMDQDNAYESTDAVEDYIYEQSNNKGEPTEQDMNNYVPIVRLDKQNIDDKKIQGSAANDEDNVYSNLNLSNVSDMSAREPIDDPSSYTYRFINEDLFNDSRIPMPIQPLGSVENDSKPSYSSTKQDEKQLDDEELKPMASHDSQHEEKEVKSKLSHD